jgi:DNA-directed RNA polymerase
MLKRQLKIEEEQLLEAASMYHDTFNNLSKMGKGTSMKSAQRLLLQWYEPMMALLFKEIEEIESGKFSADRNQYGPYLLLLPVEKIAVITLNTTLNCILRSGNIGEKLVKIAIEIANMMEAEVNMQVLKMGRDVPKWKKKITVEASQNVSRKSLGLFNKNESGPPRRR